MSKSTVISCSDATHCYDCQCETWTHCKEGQCEIKVTSGQLHRNSLSTPLQNLSWLVQIWNKSRHKVNNKLLAVKFYWSEDIQSSNTAGIMSLVYSRDKFLTSRVFTVTGICLTLEKPATPSETICVARRRQTRRYWWQMRRQLWQTC